MPATPHGSTERIPLVVAGAAGRMGRRIVALAEADGRARVAGAVEAPGSEAVGKDAGALAGIGPLGVPVRDDVQAALADAGAGAVLVDFTAPEASLANARAAAGRGLATVVGTTGLEPGQRAELEALADRSAILVSANMSVGVNVLLALVGEAVRRLGPAFDIEIVEVHHGKKKDAPSGTALALAEAAAAAAKLSPSEAFTLSRQGLTGERRAGEIGVVALRGGDNVGEHTVMLLGAGERIELVHRASSRDCLAAGAVRAAVWIAGRSPGLYSMRDVLA